MGFSFRPLTKHVGAEIVDFDIAAMEAPGNAQALRDALGRYNLLTCNVAEFSADEQVRFAQIFGEITMRGYGYPAEKDNTEYVSNTRADGTLGNGPFHFHHDHLFYEQPLSAIVLYGIEIPESGTVTKFRDAHRFYRGLPQPMQDKVDQIEQLHVLNFRTKDDASTVPHVDRDASEPPPPSKWWPLIWTNPRTNQRQALLSPAVEDFRGIDKESGFDLIRELLRIGRHEDDLDSTYLHHWRVGDLIIWDNLALAHARSPFDTTQARTLRRSPIIPVGSDSSD